MATNIELLPLCKATAGVGLDEDWIFSLSFFLADGVTPIDLTGITLTVSIFTGYGIIFTGAATISGNVATLTVLAAAKASWEPGVYNFSLLATDGTNARDVFALSTLTVDAPQIITITPITGSNILSIFGGITTAAGIASALSTLPKATLLPLTYALLVALNDLHLGDSLPASGLPMFNLSDYLVKNQ